MNDINSHSFARYRNSSLCLIFSVLGTYQRSGLLSVGGIMLYVNDPDWKGVWWTLHFKNLMVLVLVSLIVR